MTAFKHVAFDPRDPWGQRIVDSKARFRTLVCHRRFGKTLHAIAEAIEAVLSCPLPRPRAMYTCPSKAQAKKVAWDYAIALAADSGGKPNHTELRIDWPEGARLSLAGADSMAEAHRGVYLDFLALDEPALMPPSVYQTILRPTLVDRGGRAMFLGTPQGKHGLLWVMYSRGLDPDRDQYESFLYPASATGIVPDAELREARHDMTPSEYRQEFECDFTAPARGAFLADEMIAAADNGRLSITAYDQTRPVHVAFSRTERGYHFCWFFQFADDGQVHFLKTRQFPHTSVPSIVAELRAEEWGRHYGVLLMLDGERERVRRFRKYGFETRVSTKLTNRLYDFHAGIDDMRELVAKSRFDIDNCEDGIEGLRMFRAYWDAKGGSFTSGVVKDWSLDPAEAFMGIAMAGNYTFDSRQPDYSSWDASRRWGT